MRRECLPSILIVALFLGMSPRLLSAQRAVLTVEAIEVAQILQTSASNAARAIPLIAGRETIVRVYLCSPDRTLNVRGWLRIENGAEDLVYVSSTEATRVSSFQQTTVGQRRRDASLSLNFRLAPRHVPAGLLFVTLEQLVEETTGEILAWSGPSPSPVLIERDAPLRVVLAAIPIKKGGRILTPSKDDLRRAASWLRRAFPAGEVVVSMRTLTSGQLSGVVSCRDINALLLAARNLDATMGADPRTRYYGMAHHEVLSQGRGCAIGTPSQDNDFPPIASGPELVPPNGWTADLYAAHEIAHTLGAEHSMCHPSDPCCTDECSQIASLQEAIGWDHGDSEVDAPEQLLAGDSWSDISSYCPKLWVGPRTYQRMRDRLVQEDLFSPLAAITPHATGPLGPRLSLFAPEGTDAKRPVAYLAISGVFIPLKKTDRRVRLYTFPAVLPPVHPKRQPRLVVETARNSDGALQSWAQAYVEPCSRGQRKTIYFDLLVPLTKGVRSVRLLWEGLVIGQVPAGLSPPRIEKMRLVESFLTWQGDPVGRGLQYSVQQSRDDGETWETIAIGLNERTLLLAEDVLLQPRPIRFRVTAIDGLSFTSIEESFPSERGEEVGR